jgi:hypothetical protein
VHRSDGSHPNTRIFFALERIAEGTQAGLVADALKRDRCVLPDHGGGVLQIPMK